MNKKLLWLRKKRGRGKWRRHQVSKVLGLEERVSVTPWALALGPPMRKFYTISPMGPTEKERSFPLEIWQHHLCGRAASGTRRTQPTGPRLSGLGFLHVVIQCLNNPPEMNNLGLLMFTVQNCYHILSKVVVKRGTRSVRFTKPQAYRGRKYLDLKKKKTNHLYNCFALHCLNGKGK